MAHKALICGLMAGTLAHSPLYHLPRPRPAMKLRLPPTISGNKELWLVTATER